MLDVFELPDMPGPLQAKVAPAVDELPLRLTLPLAHVMVLSEPASAPGAALFKVITTSSVAVHPLDKSVTVTV